MNGDLKMSIKIENAVTPSPEQWMITIMGARNPMNSWDKSDSKIANAVLKTRQVHPGVEETYYAPCDPYISIGPNDFDLMMKLRNAGSDHRKFMRMLPVHVTVTAPLYWWKEFDTYKVGTVANSCSTMHKIHAKEFKYEDFSTDHFYLDSAEMLEKIITGLNAYREDFLQGKEESDPNTKDYWWQMIQMLPTSYNQKRTVMLNYEVLANMYRARKNHKLDEWHEFCDWIETLPYSELITGGKDAAEDIQN